MTHLEFEARARAYWTPEREKKLTAGRRYPVVPSQAAGLLRALGLLNGDASMSADATRKFIQINHMVLQMERPLLELAERFECVRVLDCGCGSSFITLLLAWCFQVRWQRPCQIVGVDSNAKLIEKSRERTAQAGLSERLRFVHAGLDAFTWDEALAATFPGAEGRPHAVIALHACDTATDLALSMALHQKADFIAVAPCCQAELAKKWLALADAKAPHPLLPVFANPNLRREIAAQLTDALRVLLVRGAGYEVTTTEFVASEHSAKNRLILGERRGNYLDEALKQHQAMVAHLGGADVLLAERLPEWVKARQQALFGA